MGKERARGDNSNRLGVKARVGGVGLVGRASSGSVLGVESVRVEV